MTLRRRWKKGGEANRHPYLRIILGSFVLLAIMLQPFSLGRAQPPLSPLADKRDDIRPQLPTFEPPKREPSKVLPPIPLPETGDIEGLSGGVRVFIQAVRIQGNTVLPAGALEALTTPFEGRALSFSEIEALVDQLTLAYVNRGYISSGATIPEQTIEDGVLKIQVVEGALGDVDVKTDGRLRSKYIRSRVQLATSGVVNVKDIEEALQLLQQDPRIKHVQAKLLPTGVRGESLLQIQVTEAKPYHAIFQFDNHEPPSIGSERGLVDVKHLNLSGMGDSLSAVFRVTEGLRAFDGVYRFPLNARELTFDAHVSLARADVVEEPFSNLDIESESETYGFTFGFPVRRTLNSRFDLYLTGDLRRSQSFLLGSGFRFTEGLSEDGVAKVAALRLGQTWSYRGRQDALALRNIVSVGFDAFDATIHSGDVPDGEFVTWFGQFQWARRIPTGLGTGQVIFRFDAQLANSPLLGMEKLAVGGYATVRGYRENELVRDNGLIGSIETRIPAFRRRAGATMLEIAPFVDIGRSWNERNTAREKKTLASAGVGVRWSATRHVYTEVYWAHAFDNVERHGESNLQDDGVHFLLSATLP